MSIEEIKNDITLRGYFFDLISRNLILGLSNTFELKPGDYVKVHKQYYESYQMLSEILEKHVEPNKVFDLIQEVSLHYIGKIGKLQFISRGIDTSIN